MGQSPLCSPSSGGPNGRSDEGNFQFCSCVPSEAQNRQAPPEINYTSEAHSDLIFSHHRLFTPHFAYKFSQFYQAENKIGEGSYGNVYKAGVRHVGPTGRPLMPAEGEEESNTQQPPPQRYVAVKTFMLYRKEEDQKSRTGRELAGRRASFEAERSILSNLEHPHIVKMYEAFEDKSMLYIVLELCRGGELYEHIVQRARQEGGGGLEEARAKLFFRQMVSAVSYLHSRRIVHRDIKTENFLVLGETGTPEGDIIKLCDFGTAVQLSDKMPRPMDRIGTLSYTAPEIYANRGADTMADAWSLGVVLYVLLVGASPFRTAASEPREETMRRIQEGSFEKRRPAWQSLSPKAQDLIQCLLVVEESKRLPSAEVMRHQWLDAGGHALSPKGTPLKADMRTEAMFALKAIRQFSTLDCLQQVLLIVCAQVTSEFDLLSRPTAILWYDLFFYLDKNEDGRIDATEFVQGMRGLLASAAPPEEQLEELALAMDIDCSGAVEWNEWIAAALLSLSSVVDEQEPLSTALRRLDRPSGDGTIGAADLLAALSSDSSWDKPAAGKRDQVLELLAWWSSSQRPGTALRNAGEVAGPVIARPACLTLPDMRRALESASAVYSEDEHVAKTRHADRPRHPSALNLRPRARAANKLRHNDKHNQMTESNKEVLVEQVRALPE